MAESVQVSNKEKTQLKEVGKIKENDMEDIIKMMFRAYVEESNYVATLERERAEYLERTKNDYWYKQWKELEEKYNELLKKYNELLNKESEVESE